MGACDCQGIWIPIFGYIYGNVNSIFVYIFGDMARRKSTTGSFGDDKYSYPSKNVPIFLNLSYLLFVSSSVESFFNSPKESIMAFLRFRAASS